MNCLSQLKNLDLDIERPEHMRQMYDRESGIRSEVVMFRLFVEEKLRNEVGSKAGDYEIVLGGFKFKIKIKCYGYCFKCKKGNFAKDCDQIKCFVCSSPDHVKRDCPLRLKELLEKKSKSKCFNCHQSGHFSNECDLNWVDPLVDEPVVKNVNFSQQS